MCVKYTHGKFDYGNNAHFRLDRKLLVLQQQQQQQTYLIQNFVVLFICQCPLKSCSNPVQQ